MDQMTQQNAALVEEAAAAAESLQEQAGSLAQAVSVFKLADDGRTRQAVGARRQPVPSPQVPHQPRDVKASGAEGRARARGG